LWCDSHLHQCKKGIWQRLILSFCPGSKIKAYKAEAKKGQLLASGVNRGRNPFILLCFLKTEAISLSPIRVSFQHWWVTTMEVCVNVALCCISSDVVDNGARGFTSIFQHVGAFNGVCFVVCMRLLMSAAMEVFESLIRYMTSVQFLNKEKYGFWHRFSSTQGQMSLSQWHFWNINEIFCFGLVKPKPIKLYDSKYFVIKTEKHILSRTVGEPRQKTW